MALNQVSPELWKAGETHYIPRVDGSGHFCLIYQTTRSVIYFRGPTGHVDAISRELLATLITIT